MSNKNCMFQYATSNSVLVDSDLITEQEACELFDENISDFKDRLLRGEDPEMAIWINCKDNCSYGETRRYWCSDDVKVFNGEIYIRA